MDQRRQLVEMLSRASRDVFERPDDAPWRDVLTSTTSWIDGDDVEGDDVDACVDVVSEEADETCAYGRSLSTEGERAAAAAAALEPTIPVESLGDEAREDDGAVRWTVSQSLRSSMDGAEDAATMEAKGTASASASAKKRARVAETPAATRGDADGDARPSASPMTMTMTTSRGDGDESAGAGRVLRFSGEESARDAPPPETRSADDATRATSRRGEYARAMTAKFTDGTPTRVMFSDASEDSSTSARAGVVVESPDESRVYVFDVDASGSTCAGSCVVRASDRRVTRRRSSLAASPRASASADAVGMTPRGDFVVAFYNPVSKRRNTQLPAARDILLSCRPKDTPVVLARNLGRADESVRVISLNDLSTEGVDMTTLVLVGASETRRIDRGSEGIWVYTPRGYAAKQAEGTGE